MTYKIYDVYNVPQKCPPKLTHSCALLFRWELNCNCTLFVSNCNCILFVYVKVIIIAVIIKELKRCRRHVEHSVKIKISLYESDI